MTNYVTDPDLLNELNGAPSSKESAPQSSADQGYVTDPALLTELNKDYVTDEELLKQLQSGPVEPTGGDLAKAAIGAVAPALYTPGATGIGELAKDVGKAVVPVATNAVKAAITGYARNPLGAVADVALMGTGLPPAYGAVKSIQGGYDAFKAAKQVATNLGEMFSQYAPGSADEAVKWVNALKPEDTVKFYEAAQKDGLDKTLKNFKAPDYLSKEATTALNATKDAIPTTFSKIGRVLGPIARTLGKVAGPAGLAMNVYDAAEFAREADLGGRLARGEAKLAPKAYTGLLNQNVSGYTPTAQEARNILDSNDDRTINIYGGRLRLEGLASPGPNAIKSGYVQQLKTLGR